MKKYKKILLIYNESGGGHKASAMALKEGIESNINPKIEVTTLNIFKDCLLQLDWSKRILGIEGEYFYNELVLKKDMTYLIKPLKFILEGNIKCHSKSAKDILYNYFLEVQPDLIISCIPFINEIIGDAAYRYSTSVPFFVLITDLYEVFPNSWIQKKSHYYICGSRVAAEQAIRLGVEESNIYRTSGMVVHPKFYNNLVNNKEEARLDLGLEKDLLTGLLMFGGYGSGKIKTIIKQFVKFSSNMQLIIICGKNLALKQELLEIKTNFPKLILGYVDNIQYYMQVSDFFIGKPGPGSISEALLSKLPVIIEDNFRVMPQEKPVIQWIKNEQLGWTTKNFSALKDIINDIPKQIGFPKHRLEKHKNIAVFEVTDIIKKFLL